MGNVKREVKEKKKKKGFTSTRREFVRREASEKRERTESGEVHL